MRDTKSARLGGPPSVVRSPEHYPPMSWGPGLPRRGGCVGGGGGGWGLGEGVGGRQTLMVSARGNGAGFRRWVCPGLRFHPEEPFNLIPAPSL